MIKMLLKLLESKITLNTHTRMHARTHACTHIFIYLKSWMEKNFSIMSHSTSHEFFPLWGGDGWGWVLPAPPQMCIYFAWYMNYRKERWKNWYILPFRQFMLQTTILVYASQTLMSHIIETKLFNNIFK